MDCFYAFDVLDLEMTRQEDDYIAEQKFIEWCRNVEDEAYELILPDYFDDLDLFEKEMNDI